MTVTIKAPALGKAGKLRDVPAMDDAIWRDGYLWLQNNAEFYLERVEVALVDGFTPEEIRYYVQRLTGDRAIALRCEHAARYLSGLPY